MSEKGRPRTYNGRTNTSIRLPPELLERLRAESVARGVSINFMINKAVVEFLDRLIPVEEMKWTRE